MLHERRLSLQVSLPISEALRDYPCFYSFYFLTKSLHKKTGLDDTRTTRFKKITSQGKGPDDKWTRKPLADQGSNCFSSICNPPPVICVNLVFKHIHAASSYTICRQFVPFIYCLCENEYFLMSNLNSKATLCRESRQSVNHICRRLFTSPSLQFNVPCSLDYIIRITTR